MVRRNVSYQFLPRPHGGGRCVVIDNDSGQILAQAYGPSDLERFEVALGNAGLPLDQVVWLTSLTRNHFR